MLEIFLLQLLGFLFCNKQPNSEELVYKEKLVEEKNITKMAISFNVREVKKAGGVIERNFNIKDTSRINLECQIGI